jgi:hypothetical protein
MSMTRGIRVAIVNCTDPDRVADFHSWYDTYAAHCTDPGLFVNARRFDNPQAADTPEGPRFLALYDVVAPDLATAWSDTEKHMKDLYPEYPDYISVVLAGTFELTASLGDSRSVETPTGGVYLLMSDSDASALHDFASRVLKTATCATGSIFNLVEGFPAGIANHVLTFDAPDAESFAALQAAVRVADEGPQPEAKLSGFFPFFSSHP